MENIIIGLIGITIGFCAGHILGSRREAEKHRLCHRRQKQARETMEGLTKFLGFDIGHEIDRAMAVEAKVENGKIVSVKPVQLPKDFGKMREESPLSSFPESIIKKPKVETTAAPVKRKRKPRTAAQKKVARDKMRIYRARKRKDQK